MKIIKKTLSKLDVILIVLIILIILILLIFIIKYNNNEIFDNNPSTTKYVLNNNNPIDRTKLYGSLFLEKIDEVIHNMTDPDIQYEKKRIELNNYSDILL